MYLNQIIEICNGFSIALKCQVYIINQYQKFFFCRNQMHEISNMATCIIETYLDFYFVYVSSNVRTQIRRQLSLSLRALSHAHTFSQTIDIFSTLLTTWTCFVGETSCNQLQLRKCLQILTHDGVTSCPKWTHCKLIT